MKKFIRIQQFCILIALSIFTISCSDDDDDKVAPRNGGGDSQTEESTITATIDGVDKTSVLVTGYRSPILGTITLSGDFDLETEESLGISLRDTTSTGTYDLKNATINFMGLIYSKDGTDSNTYIAKSGTFTLLKNDTVNNKLEGTFNFTGGNSNDNITVTNGKFNATY